MVGFAAGFGEFRKEVVGRIGFGFGLLVFGGGDGGSGDEEFEVVGGVGEVGVFLGDAFALFGHAKTSGH